MQQVGICGSDVHFWQDGLIGDFVVKKPMILGHEGSETVSKHGDGVTTLKVGDRVVIEPGVPCRRCKYCKTGRYNLCNDCVFCATPPYDGNLSRYFVHAADFCLKLPDHVSCEEGAMLESLSVSVHACNRGGVKRGNKVLILGSDIDDSRLEIGKTLGPTYTLKVTSRDHQVVAKQVEDIMGTRLRSPLSEAGHRPV
ncbi:Sorbitol dehydrogenase [Mizuhopecten yessoensis]|uniref:Sorbitol dehydrogenase n=1 Tax=Mizuhopecten yessoensis TaxID=6573 RepID=A0A210PWE8_MIZYE|nr:Sorbitol dehydrogenase [Mizuhopecten yessoensis]